MSEKLSVKATEDEYPNGAYVDIFSRINSGEGEVSDDLIDSRVGAQELTVEEGTDLKYLLNKRKNEAESEKANTDLLTGLYNRRYFDEVAPKVRQDLLVADEKRTNPPEMLLLINIDLNLLKNINDTYGHVAGDEALKMLSQAIKSHIRRQDVAARVGGDEFLILMELSRDNATPETVIQNLQDALRGLFIKCQTKEGKEIEMPVEATIGYGVLHRSNHDTTLEQLKEQADEAMYQNKRASEKEIIK